MTCAPRLKGNSMAFPNGTSSRIEYGVGSDPCCHKIQIVDAGAQYFYTKPYG